MKMPKPATELAYEYVEGILGDALDRSVREDIEYFADGYVLTDEEYLRRATDHATYLLETLLSKLGRRGV